MTENKAKKSDRQKRAKEREERRMQRRVRFWYSLLKRPAGCVADRKTNFKAEKVPAQPNNYLMLYNHNTDFDFILAASKFREPMYFVASEHILQKGIASKLLDHCFAPIGRVKGTTAAKTVMAILRTLKRGDNVCLAAEGNRSWNGRTCPILFSTGKLAKSSGAALITYRMIGGYLTTPRWSYTTRKGKMTGEVVRVYSPEELANMTAEEVNEAINRDLFEDAYTRQEQEKTAFRGERLAEGLEHALYMCPECGAIGKLTSLGDKLSCECGASVTYDEYGYLSGGKFNTVISWDEWQNARLCELIDNASEDDVLFSDEEEELYAVDSNHVRVLKSKGRLSMTRTAMTLCEDSFPLAEMSGLAIYGRKNMVFEHGGVHYEITSPNRLCCTKYVAARDYIRNSQKK